jgi:membrane-bound lytic murein transglycosylase A
MVPNKGLKQVFLASALGATMLFWACTPRPVTRETALKRLNKADYPRFTDQLNYARLDAGIDRSLAYLRKLPPQRPVVFGPDTYTVAHLIRSLQAFAAIVKDHPDADELGRLIAERFAVYQAIGSDESGTVLFTGYYEPLLQGRKKKSVDFPVPVNSRPADLLSIDLSPFSPDLSGRRIIGRYANRTVVPYPDRAHIRRESDFNTIAPPIVWLHDEIDLFTLMVQGSGKVRLKDGQTLQIGFDISNGLPYRSIGRMMIKRGKISANRMSMQAIREYLIQHPGQAAQIMNQNPRYIFFRQLPQGPLGALGVAITPKRSLAVDRDFFPAAALAFISVSLPQVDERGAIRQSAPFSGFALAQDTGDAISGPGHVDLFCGSGLQAGVTAGHLKHGGQLYFLVLKPTATAGG